MSEDSILNCILLLPESTTEMGQCEGDQMHILCVESLRDLKRDSLC